MNMLWSRKSSWQSTELNNAYFFPSWVRESTRQNSVKRGENPQIWYAICHSWAPRRVTIILQLWFSTQLICSVFLALTGQSLGVDNILVRAGCWLKRIVGIFATSFHLLLSIIFLLITSYALRRFSIQFPYCSLRGYTFTIANWRKNHELMSGPRRPPPPRHCCHRLFSSKHR